MKHSKITFETGRGIKQGNLDSPPYLNIYFDFCIEVAEFQMIQKQQLSRHIRTVHNNTKITQRASAENRKNEESNLNKHFKEIHKNTKDYQCEYCEN